MVKNELVDLSNSFTKLELTKTQRERAEKLYTSICNYLVKQTELDIKFYPQGSFATKTVVRPYIKGKDRLYDVDVICEVQGAKSDLNAETLMNIFDDALTNSIYKYDRWDKCFTIEYSDTETAEFSIDIIPAVIAPQEKMIEIMLSTERKDLVDTSIAIPNVTKNNSNWIVNNPKGYVTWFDERTKFFEKQFRIMREQNMVNSLEELPEDHATNMLKNVIKMLKRARDVYFSKAVSENKPASIILTTIIAKLSNAFVHLDFNHEYNLFKAVVNELNQLKYLDSKSSISRSLDQGYLIGNIIQKNNKKWELNNPANGLDNILSSWNESPNISMEFFNWVEFLKDTIEIVDSDHEEESRKQTELYNIFNLDLQNKKSISFKVNEKKTRPWG